MISQVELAVYLQTQFSGEIRCIYIDNYNQDMTKLICSSFNSGVAFSADQPYSGLKIVSYYTLMLL